MLQAADDRMSGLFDYEGRLSRPSGNTAGGTLLRLRRPEQRAGAFPVAHSHSTGKDVTIWCSNDYLGVDPGIPVHLPP